MESDENNDVDDEHVDDAEENSMMTSESSQNSPRAK